MNKLSEILESKIIKTAPSTSRHPSKAVLFDDLISALGLDDLDFVEQFHTLNEMVDETVHYFAGSRDTKKCLLGRALTEASNLKKDYVLVKVLD
jgi:hypothetical protein